MGEAEGRYPGVAFVFFFSLGLFTLIFSIILHGSPFEGRGPSHVFYIHGWERLSGRRPDKRLMVLGVRGLILATAGFFLAWKKRWTRNTYEYDVILIPTVVGLVGLALLKTCMSISRVVAQSE